MAVTLAVQQDEIITQLINTVTHIFYNLYIYIRPVFRREKSVDTGRIPVRGRSLQTPIRSRIVTYLHSRKVRIVIIDPVLYLQHNVDEGLVRGVLVLGGRVEAVEAQREAKFLWISDGSQWDSAAGAGAASGERCRSNISRISFGSVPAGTVTVPVCVDIPYEYHLTFFSAATRGGRLCLGDAIEVIQLTILTLSIFIS